MFWPRISCCHVPRCWLLLQDLWPASFWEKLYEPIIRWSAGLERPPENTDPDEYEKAFSFAMCSLLAPVKRFHGALSRSLVARVVLCESFQFGGRLLSGVFYRRHGQSTGLPVSLLSSRAFEVLLMSRTTVVGAYDSGTYAALERVSDFSTPPAHLPRQRLWRIVARRTVVACGAIERPMLSATTIGPGNVSIGSANLYKQVCRRRGAPHRSFHQ